ncbi:MAG: hypothetical protein ACFFCQ_16865 [Promethearchaeota archaeon]
MTRFPALHTIAGLFKVLAWIAGGVTALLFILTVAGVGSLSRYSYGGGVTALIAGIIILLIGGFYVLVLYAFAEGILVALAIEENTRGESKNVIKNNPTEKAEEEADPKKDVEDEAKKASEEEKVLALKTEYKKKREDDFLKY